MLFRFDGRPNLVEGREDEYPLAGGFILMRVLRFWSRLERQAWFASLIWGERMGPTRETSMALTGNVQQPTSRCLFS